MSVRVDPLPAVAAGRGPFVVVHLPLEAGGRCAEPIGGQAGLLAAPLDTGSEEALAIRQHEYGHLGLLARGIEPRHAHRTLADQGIHDYWIQGALDVVVNAYMLAQGCREVATLNPGTGEPLPDRWLRALVYLRCEGLAVAREARPALALACRFSASELSLLTSAAQTLARLGRDARRISVNQLAHLLGHLQRTFGPDVSRQPTQAHDEPVDGHGGLRVPAGAAPATALPVGPRPGSDLTAGASRVRENLERQRLLRRLIELLALAARRRKTPTRTSVRRGAVRARAAMRGASSADGQSGAMSILRPPLSRVARVTTHTRRFLPGYSGALRYPHRALQPAGDGREFAAARRVAGGTLLVDCSGSMSLTIEEVGRVLDRAPAATVALYASLPHTLCEGRLVVVASRGRLVESADLATWFGEGNVVDVPALEWLCTQPGPRSWVTDGVVTGVDDMPHQTLDARAAVLVQHGRIAVYESLSDLWRPTRGRPVTTPATRD